MHVNFGNYLLKLRIRAKLSLRDVCNQVDYDPSNWSKIERNRLAPPSDDETLQKWAGVLGLRPETKEYRDFFDRAHLAKGLIPTDILNNTNAMEKMPALLRRLRKYSADEREQQKEDESS